MSIRIMMIVIAVLGLAMFAVRQMFFANTVYSTRYDESRFQQVRVGMSSEEVEDLIGSPLKRIPWWPDRDLVCWEYAYARRTSKHYWRRDVFIKNDKVVEIMAWYEWPD